MTQKFTAQISSFLLDGDGGAAVPREGAGEVEEGVEGAAGRESAAGGEAAGTVRLYFPDAGSAALAQRDWKVGTPESLVPPSTRFASLSRDRPAATDRALIMVCPKASEVDSLKVVLRDVEEELNIPVIFINPELVNMGVTGFGAAGRMLREQLIDTLVNTYYLRTLEWGAVTRAYPRAFTVHQTDAAAEGGYRIVKTTERLLNSEQLDELFDELFSAGGAAGGAGASGGNGFFKSLGAFIDGFSKI